MPDKGVVSTVSFVLTNRTTDLLLLLIMDGVFMSREIIWPTEDYIATLASGWIDALAFVLAILTTADNWRAFLMGKHMFFELLSRLKTAFAAMICACVATRIYESRSISWPLHVRVVVVIIIIIVVVVVYGALICWSTTLLTRCVDIRERRVPCRDNTC